MSEARKCDRCNRFYELSEEDQKNRDYPYYMKGPYVKIMVFDRYGEQEDSTRWYDLCPKCVELLYKWLYNPDNYDPHDLVKNVDEEYKDPCKSCHDGVCEQCCYGYCSEEEKKNRWLGNHKEEAKLSDPYEDGGL